jgi:hypothetical protein
VTPVLKMVMVCNSGGMRLRPLVETTPGWPGGQEGEIHHHQRAGMRFRLILGRKSAERFCR